MPDTPAYYLLTLDRGEEGEPLVIECRKIIEALELSWHVGDAFAYLWRAGKKPGSPVLSDLEKAAQHLACEIERLKRQEGTGT